jgi:hypothetical protein
MGTAAKKPKAQRSKRSGVKKLKLVQSNLSILKKLGAFVLILGLLSSCIVIAPRHHHGFHHHYHRSN